MTGVESWCAIVDQWTKKRNGEINKAARALLSRRKVGEEEIPADISNEIQDRAADRACWTFAVQRKPVSDGFSSFHPLTSTVPRSYIKGDFTDRQLMNPAVRAYIGNIRRRVYVSSKYE